MPGDGILVLFFAVKFLEAKKLLAVVPELTFGGNLVEGEMTVVELMVPGAGFFSVSVITVVAPKVVVPLKVVVSEGGEAVGERGVVLEGGFVP